MIYQEAIKTNSLLLQLFETSPQAVAVFDKQMCYIGFNPSWMRNYGLEGKDIMGKSHYEVFPEIPQRWKDLHDRCLQGEILSHEADSFPRLDGRVDYIAWNIRPWHQDNGTIGGIIMYTEIITERIETQQALNKSRAQYKTLVENNPDYITELDADMRLKYINNVPPEIMQQVFERDYISVIEKFSPDVNLVLLRDLLERAKVEKKTQFFESSGTLRNGEEVGWYSTRIVPILQQDQFMGFTLVATDITAHKRAEEEREKLIADLQVANTLAEENSRLKSEFLATMSHELRTPMNAIEGFTSLMLSQMGGATYNDKSAHYLGKISSNSKRLLGLINDFLDLSRIESGRMDLIIQPFQLEPLVQSWVDDIIVLVQEKGLKFVMDIDPDMPAMIYGDSENISKIAINLLSNAIKFTEQGAIKLKIKRDGDMWEMQVEDTGIGIPVHAHEYIFDEFRQVDQTSKRRFGGSGLGLAIVQKIMRLMQGTVTLTSVVDEGSTFVVRLPLMTQSPAPEVQYFTTR